MCAIRLRETAVGAVVSSGHKCDASVGIGGGVKMSFRLSIHSIADLGGETRLALAGN
jgi:hypothetical protein